MFQDQIKEMCVKIISHLDTLEHNILQDVDAYSLTALMSLCNLSTVVEFLESCYNILSIFDLIVFSVSSTSCRILCSSVSNCEIILTRIFLIWS
jgi:hypothetical protein